MWARGPWADRRSLTLKVSSARSRSARPAAVKEMAAAARSMQPSRHFAGLLGGPSGRGTCRELVSTEEHGQPTVANYGGYVPGLTGFVGRIETSHPSAQPKHVRPARGRTNRPRES